MRAASRGPGRGDGVPVPEAYTPKHLAERILTTKAALEGERKQVTVLFADLKGSMELLADRDPEEARKILDPVLAQMMDAVHYYEGTVNQVMGDTRTRNGRCKLPALAARGAALGAVDIERRGVLGCFVPR
jgi:class 3 adenylate cyclase